MDFNLRLSEHQIFIKKQKIQVKQKFTCLKSNSLPKLKILLEVLKSEKSYCETSIYKG